MANEPEDILALEDSVTYVRGNFNDIFPVTENRRKTFGNIPARLHAELKAYAKAHGVKTYEVVAGLWDFHKEYEEIYADELKVQRAKTKSRRK